MYVTEQFVQIVHMNTQDRRITKTRKAIYQAFLHLLNQKDYEAITVQEIIDLADVGRSTFYSHYESKELLLDELCQKLFHHLFERAEHLSPQDYLAHIFQHFKKNQDHVTSLLLSKNDYFIRQLRKELEHDVYPMVADELIQSYPTFLTPISNTLVVSHFIETLSWWLKKGKSYSEQRSDPVLFGDSESGFELEGSIFNDQRAILLSISITLHASRTRRNRLDAILCQKNINPVSKQSNPILLHSFCFQLYCLGAISHPNDVAIS